MTETIDARFSGAQAEDYDFRMPKLVAGYDIMHEISAAYLRQSLPKGAHILVVGAGTCKEIIKLAELEASWRFTAVDLSQDMLDIGLQKLKEKGHDSRVEFFCGEPSQLNTSNGFDAAMSMLVMHFIDKEQKSGFLSSIQQRLKPNSPLVLADLMHTHMPDFVDIQMLLSQQLGMSFETACEIKPRFERNFKPLTVEEFKALIKGAGFKWQGSIFQSLNFYCWLCST